MKASIGRFASLVKKSSLLHGYSLGYGNIAVRYDTDNTAALHRQAFLQDLGGRWDAFAVLSPNLKGYLQKAEKREDTVTENEGIMTLQKNLLLALPLADCRGSIVSFQTGRGENGVALLHGSWRSISKQYPMRAMETLKKMGCDPKEMVIGVTPGICNKHLVLDYLDEHSLQREGWEKAKAIEQQEDGWHLDTKKYLLWQYQQAGVPLSQITLAPECTYEVMEQSEQHGLSSQLYSHKYAITHPRVVQQRFWLVAGLQE